MMVSAREGELVRFADGRWARFQRCTLSDGQPGPFLVAVELDSHHQRMLSEVEGSFEAYRARGVPVRVRIDPEADGSEQVRFAEDFAVSAAVGF